MRCVTSQKHATFTFLSISLRREDDFFYSSVSSHLVLHTVNVTILNTTNTNTLKRCYEESRIDSVTWPFQSLTSWASQQRVSGCRFLSLKIAYSNYIIAYYILQGLKILHKRNETVNPLKRTILLKFNSNLPILIFSIFSQISMIPYVIIFS